jgi:TMEM175 potassium channel family protein
MSTSRLEAFSDGVFAIAITLLVLEIHTPSPRGGETLAHALGREWPSYAAYVVSFLTIGIVWLNHHALFTRVGGSDRTLMFVNLLLLMAVSFIPFPTGILATYMKAGHDQHAAAALYAGTWLAVGACFTTLVRYTRRADLLAQHVSEEARRAIMRRNAVGPVAYVTAFGLAFVSAPASLAVCAAVALFYTHPGRAPA